MSEPFSAIREAVRALTAAEWENFHASIHRPGAKRAEAIRLRDERMDEVYRQIQAIRGGETDPRFSLETVEARLKELARVCNGLIIWDRLCPKAEPALSYLVPLDAETILAEMCEKVERALHEVLDLAAPGSGRPAGDGPQAPQEQTAACPDGQAPEERLRFDPDTLTVTLDGTPYENLDPTAYLILEAIWQGQRRPVSSKTLDDMHGLHGKKIDRELKKLPQELQAIIKGKPGSGRWLELPPENCL
jgi:hypothetical protein